MINHPELPIDALIDANLAAARIPTHPSELKEGDIATRHSLMGMFSDAQGVRRRLVRAEETRDAIHNHLNRS